MTHDIVQISAASIDENICAIGKPCTIGQLLDHAHKLAR
jgi:hypothetical protein